MKNREHWKPSKYILKNGRLIASRDPNEVGIGSRLIADLVAEKYHDSLPKHAKGNLLDLGCGKVPLFAAYEKLVTHNTCVDWGNSPHKNHYLDLECDLGENLPFNNDEFDTIILSDVLEHIFRPDHLWDEMSRVLKIGGKVILNVPFYYWLHEHPHDYYRYTEYALRRFVENSGLKLISIEPVGGAPEIMADIFAKNILRVPIFGRLMAVFVQWLIFSLKHTLLFGKISKCTQDSFPLGYFLIAEKQKY